MKFNPKAVYTFKKAVIFLNIISLNQTRGSTNQSESIIHSSVISSFLWHPCKAYYTAAYRHIVPVNTWHLG